MSQFNPLDSLVVNCGKRDLSSINLLWHFENTLAMFEARCVVPESKINES